MERLGNVWCVCGDLFDTLHSEQLHLLFLICILFICTNWQHWQSSCVWRCHVIVVQVILLFRLWAYVWCYFFITFTFTMHGFYFWQCICTLCGINALTWIINFLTSSPTGNSFHFKIWWKVITFIGYIWLYIMWG